MGTVCFGFVKSVIRHVKGVQKSIAVEEYLKVELDKYIP